MAKQVEGISEKVELCAKKEFLEKGYVDASLRTIAAEAGTTTGTIYSRYGGKEGLFSAIVEPVAKEFTGIFIGVQEKFHAIESDRQAVSLDDYAEDGMKQLVKYMYAHLEEFQILPLSVLTFVENAVKYGVQSQKTLLISIRVSLLPGETPEDTYVCITILDNGPGFPEELLHFLNKEEFAEEKTAGIGIQNVWKRIKIRYEEKATILYSNSNGACVEMYLPYEKY